MARHGCPPDGLLASSQANAVLCAAPQRLHQSSYTERCALLSLTKSYAITPRSTQARPSIARLRFVVCRALICASVMPLPRSLRRIESLFLGRGGRFLMTEIRWALKGHRVFGYVESGLGGLIAPEQKFCEKARGNTRRRRTRLSRNARECRFGLCITFHQQIIARLWRFL